MFSFFFYLLPLWLTDPDSSQRRKKRERERDKNCMRGDHFFLIWLFVLLYFFLLISPHDVFDIQRSNLFPSFGRETGVWIALRAEGNFLKERERETGINIADHGEELEGWRKGLFEEAKKNRDADKTQGTVRGEADLVWIHLTLSSQTVLKKRSLKESQGSRSVSSPF